MISFLRVVRLMSIVVWVGGLVFFAFVVAPTAFGVLASKHEAGMVVAGTLGTLNRMGLVCAALFAIAAMLMTAAGAKGRIGFSIAQVILVMLMAGATDYLQTRIIPAMERDRITAGGDVDAAAADNPARMDFERLHPISERVGGTALLLGLGVVVLMALEGGDGQRRSTGVTESD